VWFAQPLSKALAALSRFLPANPTLRIGVAIASGWTLLGVVLYTSSTLGSATSRTGRQVNHTHGHVLHAALTALALTVFGSIICAILFAIRSDDSSN